LTREETIVYCIQVIRSGKPAESLDETGRASENIVLATKLPVMPVELQEVPLETGRKEMIDF